MHGIEESSLKDLNNEYSQALSQIKDAFHSDAWNDEINESYESFLKHISNLSEHLDEAVHGTFKMIDSLNTEKIERRINNAQRLCSEAENI